MSAGFAHLHLHSEYSLLDGAIRLKDLFPRLRDYGMDSVALTDHGNMFGALDFYTRARKEGVKPIFGCETYIARDRHDRSSGRDAHHLILLAKNLEGYRNLTYLASMAYLEGFYYVPRIDKAILREHRAGLVGLTACLGGEVPQTILQKGIARAEEVVREYAGIFEPGSFYLEVQPNGLTEQEEVNQALVKLSRKTGVPLVATNDCHYLDRKDARAHDLLMCIQMGKNVDDENRVKHTVDEYFLKSRAEMEASFAELPEAIENAGTLAAACSVELDLSKTYLPRYSVPEGESLETFLVATAREGLARRLEEAVPGRGRPRDRDAYAARLEHELSVINAMGFAGYFLIVWDFIRFAKQSGIPVGPGRGSGAGSLVAWSLRITDIDPIRFVLLFERFLNPERVSMPDFDIDFCMNRRDEVIRYVSEKYGRDNVGQIATMHSLKARGVVRDVARVMGLSYAEGDRVAKLIPEPIQGKSVSIPEALEQEPRLRELAEGDAKVKDLLEVASALEGLNRHAGMHAAGVVISEKPLWEYVPCFKGQNGEIVTQYSKDFVEKTGLVKFDFLGLKTMTVLDIAKRLVEARAPGFDLEAVPIDDQPTFDLLKAGATTGVFQAESQGFKELLKKLQPDCIEDIIAAVALYRPGPLEGGMVDDFVKCKHGQKQVVYPHHSLEPILRETYGVIVYQEQVMQIASALAGFSLGQADILRRAMGKKKPEEMEKQKKVFLEGAAKKGIDEKLAEEVFDLMAKFAGYGFNKSHSAAYAIISYQTAYLKSHFPEEFMAALLTCEKDHTENLTKFIAEASSMGIQVLRPDLNESASDFTVVTTDGTRYIRFGLSAVRNVGETAVEAILETRREGPFTGLFEFCERVDARRVNKRVIEALIKCGAFDGVAAGRELTRARLLAALDGAQERAVAAQRDRETGQTSLFGMLGGEAKGEVTHVLDEDQKYPDVPDWQPRQRLAFEKESLGFYVSGHPLDRFEEDLRRFASATVSVLDTMPERTEVSLGGLVAAYRERPLKSGKGRMAFFSLEDRSGSVEVVAFSKPFEEFEAVLKSAEPVLVAGTLVFEGDAEGESRLPKIHMKSAVTLPTLRTQKTTEMHLHLDGDRVKGESLKKLKEVLLGHVGECRTYIHIALKKRSQTKLVLSERFSVKPTDDLLLELERLFGERVAQLR
jgi:DNA polymerase III subunit alpha